MNIVTKKYRIVRCRYFTHRNFQVEIWRIWFPFWVEARFVNTHRSIKRAEEYIKNGCRYEVYVKETFKTIISKQINIK